ncbi:hypothetical protein H9I45_08230 [Polaribacter haliotis]|uniref:Uncharacterized protein n=1 Tax=Polaribacter haliotis TaxID=1888915 RepID=A0A7L8ABQ8_9FLAO|nr:hypothetical protein [Polaribacter haliotis]QOD59364.1 hypothetical protein H9I45_08230 [Polaribacter haliotis]
MAKYLTDISIESEFSQEFSNGFTKLDFNKTTKVVQDIFWYLIPNKFEFDGIGKLNIRITSAIPDNKYKETAVGFAQYTYGQFEFSKYFKLHQTEQNKVILKILQKAISDILKHNQEKANTLIEITNRISDIGFEYETEDKKLSKWNRKRNYRGLVIYKIDKNGQNAYVTLTDKNGVVFFREHLLKNRVYDFFNSLYKTKWIGEKFQIINRDGNLFKEFDAEKTAYNNVYKK